MEAAREPQFRIRPATVEDCGLILRFIRELASYERMSHLVVATEEGLREALFRKKHAEVVIGEEDGAPVAFALFFHNFSTFLGKAGIYLEDLYVREDKRGRGYGRRLFQHLAGLALERDCGRLDWSCLDWNHSSIAFYRRMKATALSDWTGYRLEGDSLTRMARCGHPDGQMLMDN